MTRRDLTPAPFPERRRPGRSALFLVLLLPVAAPAQPEKPLQERIHAAIDLAEPSVACVSVSRSERYRDFRADPPADFSGRLGGFNSLPFLRNPFETNERKELARRLDLRLPGAVPDGYGTGIVIDRAGLVLTQAHLLRGAKKVFVRLSGGEGSYADLHAADPRSDLAVLKLLDPPADLRSLPRGDGESLRKGDLLVGLANGYNTGFLDGSVSSSFGSVSNLRRRPPGPAREADRTQPLYQYGTLIQTDLRLPPGTSGGALLTLDGRWVGVTTSLASLTGADTAQGFAYPLDAMLGRVIDVLARGEEVEYGQLGVALQPGNETSGGGVLVADVTPGSPAERAGLVPGDILTAVNRRPIRDGNDLFLTVGGLLAGTEVRLETLRLGKGRTCPAVRLGRQAMPPNPLVRKSSPAALGIRVEFASVLSLKTLPAGVAVRELVADSPAAKALKPQRDTSRLVVEEVDGQAVGTPAEFIEATRGKAGFTLTVVDAVEDFAATRRQVKVP